VRGTGAQILIGEEMAFMNNEFYKKVIVPILAANATFIGITTLGNETNFVERLFNLKYPNGESVFNTVRIEQVCERCKELGLESSCTHKMSEIPPWQSAERHRDIKIILADDEETFLRETKSYFLIIFFYSFFFLQKCRGIQSNASMVQVFKTEDVKSFRNRIHQAGTAHRIVFTAVDPNAGGHGSKFAIVSCIFEDHKMIVIYFFFLFFFFYIFLCII